MEVFLVFVAMMVGLFVHGDLGFMGCGANSSGRVRGCGRLASEPRYFGLAPFTLNKL